MTSLLSLSCGVAVVSPSVRFFLLVNDTLFGGHRVELGVSLNVVAITRARLGCDVSEMICRCGNQLKAPYEYCQM